jgi:acetolactate synthase-1/2/3 large subunit
VPLIFLTGCIDPADRLSYTHQVVDHGALLRPIAKASFTIADGAVDVAIDKALAIALDDPPGPVHLDLPIGTAIVGQPEAPPVRRMRPALAGPAPSAALDTARRWLSEAERPIMIAGVEVLHHAAEEAVAAFARDFSFPLITTYKAKGVLPEDDPLALGGAGLSPTADRHLLPLVRTSDLVLLAGYDPIEMRMGWRQPWGPAHRVVEFSAVPNTHYMHQARLSFVGDVGAGLAALRDAVPPRPTWPGGEPARVREALAAAFNSDEVWGPAAIAETVRRLLPRDAIASADSGAHRILLSQVWRSYAPRTLLQSSGLGSMGGALPLAIGAKLAEPERPVVAFTGDAGLEMVLGELATLRDLALPVVVVVFADASLALIALKQRQAGLAEAGVAFGETDFATVARALGGHGATVEDRESLAEAVREALAADRFTVIACRIPTGAYDGRL